MVLYPRTDFKLISTGVFSVFSRISVLTSHVYNCTNERNGYTCKCPTGFDGPRCDGDPCTSSEMLPQMEERSNPYSAIGSVTDENLAKAWYSAPEGMKMSDHAPPSGPACGAQNGLWSKMREGTSEYICLPFKDDTCKSMTTMKSMLCDGRRVYGIEKALWTSSYCFECRPDPIDLLFIQDVSSSVMKSVYDEMRLFIKYFVGDIDASQDAHNVALMTFAKEPKIAFHLNTYNTKTSIMSAIRSVNGTGGGTYLGKALELAASDIFTENNGDRGDSKNVVILLTDGRSKNTADVYKNVNALKGTAELFVVTSVISDMFADMPSSALSSNHVFTLSDTDGERFTRVILPDRFCNMAP
ncbi:collagen alpha-5(VI) chain-like [Haliotis rufescens]|uniref:collagen alpha-5(VI) chain-like n=1 Tax=Haliotis rufescens TaxID=6454 RepID=UPI00201EF449|nr:collagen alpha-5(VI) chain-like [Haliotis rufescens]XP_048237062.1 collagen alpha-5(VI) chain-like [Haliotis rufescens]XP_048237063.1 collagen alpha-5(VI) chain-like [Haliotis rufescens]